MESVSLSDRPDHHSGSDRFPEHLYRQSDGKALVIQLGDPVDKVFGPGLHFKIPLIQTVVRFDARVLDYEARAQRP